MSRPPLCIYHANCLDGMTAAWAVWKKFPEAEFIAAKYGDPIPMPDALEGRDVYIVDFSYKRPELVRLMLSVTPPNRFVLLDHHKTALEDLGTLFDQLPAHKLAVLDMHKSGARLAWEFFHQDFETLRRPRPTGERFDSDHAPMIVQVVESRDLWKFDRLNTNELTAWLGSYDTDNMEEWDSLATQLNSLEGYDQALDAGVTLLRRRKIEVAECLKHKRQLDLGKGARCMAVNAPPWLGSEVGHELAKNSVAGFGCVYHDSIGGRAYSLRSAGEVDVSAIAARFGGGGHHNAAGFFIEDLYARPDDKAFELETARFSKVVAQGIRDESGGDIEVVEVPMPKAH